MELERLKEYEAEELQEFEEHKKRALAGEAGIFPPYSRFSRISQPVAVRTVQTSLWSQIPMFGSLLINIAPVNRENFARVHRFDFRDLNRLINLCKDTGRVQFVLADRPTFYAGLDHLDSLFTEIKPPLRLTLNPTYLATKDELRTWRVEFDTLGRIRFFDMVQQVLGASGHNALSIQSRYEEYIVQYCNLKLMRYAKASDFVLNALVDNPALAWEALRIYDRLLTKPIIDPMKAMYCYSYDELASPLGTEMHNNLQFQRKSFPAEIGVFLMKQLAPIPDSFEGAMSLLYRYEQEDLQKLISALDQATKDGKLDLAKAKSADISEVIENSWKEASKISRLSKGISYGATVSLVLGGLVASQLLGSGATTAGLLASLGFQLADKSIGEFSPSESVARNISKGYVGTVFDFRKKYNLT